MSKFTEYLEASSKKKEASIFAPYKTIEEGFKDIFREIQVRKLSSLTLLFGQLAATLEGRGKNSIFHSFTTPKKGFELIEKEIATLGAKANPILILLKRLEQTLKKKGKIK